jgi:hypothetical protein|nr:MAG: hypothetical protein [Bacteriophage sp.]
MTKKVQLVSEWKQAHKLWSMRLAAIGATLTSILIASPDAALYAWNLLPSDLKAYIPEKYTPLIGVGIFILSMFARLIKQSNLKGKDNDEVSSDS